MKYYGKFNDPKDLITVEKGEQIVGEQIEEALDDGGAIRVELDAKADLVNGKVPPEQLPSIASEVIVYQAQAPTDTNIKFWWEASIDGALPIGGRIYKDAGDNGATYVFYDEDYNEITYDGTIASLAEAKYYTITGSHSTDRFLVADLEDRSVSYDGTTYTVSKGVLSGAQLGFSGTLIGADGTGVFTGRTNTAKYLAEESGAGNMVNLVRAYNAEEVGGCNDWYIPSWYDTDYYKLSNINPSLPWSNSHVLTSSETSPTNLFACYNNTGWMNNISKVDSYDYSYRKAFLVRSF